MSHCLGTQREAYSIRRCASSIATLATSFFRSRSWAFHLVLVLGIAPGPDKLDGVPTLDQLVVEMLAAFMHRLPTRFVGLVVEMG